MVVSQKVCKVEPHRVHVTGCFLAVTLLLLAPIEIFFPCLLTDLRLTRSACDASLTYRVALTMALHSEVLLTDSIRSKGTWSYMIEQPQVGHP